MNKGFYSIPVVAITLILVVVLFEFSSVDAIVQSLIYNNDTQIWLVDKNDQLLDLIFYSGIKKIFISLVLFLLFSLIFLRKFNWVKKNTNGMIIVV